MIPLLASLIACTSSTDTAGVEGFVPEEIGRCAHYTPNRMPLYGDTHVHTALSLDAALQGTRLRPADAYRFAQGEELGIQPYDASGEPLRTAKLKRSLDWAVVSDHAEFLGLVSVCTSPDLAGYDDPVCARYRSDPDASFLELNALLGATADIAQPPPLCAVDGVDCDDATATAWTEVRDAAEAAYDRTDRCNFTSFVGYEWSSNPTSYNLHRNVIFRNEQVPELPTGYFAEPTVEGLWASLFDSCLDELPGCDALTIPHNSNLSNGLMFEGVDRDGAPIDTDYAVKRAAMEPLVEIFQHKGSSECLLGSAAGDELCGFEYLPYNSLANANLDLQSPPQAGDFVRDALGIGLELERTLGVNPYKYGIVASTDTHLGTPGLAFEKDFPGHGGAGSSNREELPEGLPDLLTFNPGGLAVVWAEENSREAIWQAMERREAYGTSGPRITLRVFAGFGLPDLCEADDFAAEGYAGGVPMGGDLTPGDGPMRISVAALADPETLSTALQRIQVVKGALGSDGLEFEVFDIAGDPAAGADPGGCAIQQDVGFRDLCTSWIDPTFDPAEPAFWYVRVLEIPTCRWNARQCALEDVDCSDPETVPSEWAVCCDPDAPQFIQERAWSSPIWFSPDE